MSAQNISLFYFNFASWGRVTTMTVPNRNYKLKKIKSFIELPLIWCNNLKSDECTEYFFVSF